MPTQYVDGEEEQLGLAEPLVRQGQRQLAAIYRRPVPDEVVELLRWIARESFRLGYGHAHDRNTMPEELWPEDEVTK
jgi:hypothetical protein